MEIFSVGCDTSYPVGTPELRTTPPPAVCGTGVTTTTTERKTVWSFVSSGTRLK